MQNHPEDKDSNIENHCPHDCQCKKDFKDSDWFALLIFALLVGAFCFAALHFWK